MSRLVTPEAAAALTSRKPLYRRPEEERRLIVRALEGELVTVVEDRNRDGSEDPLVGVILGICSNPGVGAALVIVRDERGRLLALSSARVSRIEVRS